MRNSFTQVILLESLCQDMRYAVRTLRRTPLFVVTVAATMGLGLGLVGSAFTILNAPPRSALPLGWRSRPA